MPRLLTLLVVMAIMAGQAATAAETSVAVAANFTDAAKEIAAAFKQKTGHDAALSFGSTGQLYAQITQAAPYDILLSADDRRPAAAVTEGLGVAGSVFTYAVGRLVLWSRTPGLVTSEATLAAGHFEKLAVCDPEAAPYGAAAAETLRALHLADRLAPKLVVGANISQAFQFVDTGNAELGFVALSQLTGRSDGSRWAVPQALYRPIRQDAVLLKRGSANPAATDFLRFLRGPDAQAIMARYGYALPQ